MMEYFKRLIALEKTVEEVKAKLINLPARWAQVAPLQMQCMELELTEDLTRGGTSSDAKILRWNDGGGTWDDTGQTTDVTDIGRITTSKKLESGDQIGAKRIGGKVWLSEYDCEDLVNDV